MESLAAREHRTTLLLNADATRDGLDAAVGFGRRHGLQPAQVRYRSDLDLTDPRLPEVLQALEDAGRPSSADYDLVTWWDEPPATWLDQRAALNEATSDAIPLGEVDLHRQRWDGARVLEAARVQRAQGRRVVETVAVHRTSGQPVAFSTLVWSAHRPLLAFERDTLVLGAHPRP